MVAGQDPVHFSGPTYTAPATSPVSSVGTNTTMATSSPSGVGNGSIGGAPAASYSGARPIDNGAGPVGASSRPSSVAGPLPSTSIE
jgi:hypothetical protein